jgi:RNA polymerase sigma factor (TIGR02999 family)
MSTTDSRTSKSDPGDHSITRWLARLQAGDPDALDRLVPLVYDELRRVARRQIRQESPANTLSATTLVHEVYLRLVKQRQIAADDRDAFLGIAAQTMRRILVDHARHRTRLKRGGPHSPVSLDDEHEPALLTDDEVEEVLVVDAVLERLGALDERAAHVVEYRIFAGLTLEETATVLGTSIKTVQRDWTTARAWLRKEMAGSRLV